MRIENIQQLFPPSGVIASVRHLANLLLTLLFGPCPLLLWSVLVLYDSAPGSPALGAGPHPQTVPGFATVHSPPAAPDPATATVSSSALPSADISTAAPKCAFDDPSSSLLCDGEGQSTCPLLKMKLIMTVIFHRLIRKCY